MKAYLYILDTLADWEIGYLTAELNSGRYLDRTREPVTLVKTGNTKKPVVTMGGMVITPDESIDKVEFLAGDLLILPGADTWLDGSNRKVIEIVSGMMNTEVIIAAICGATIALAEQGLLNERKHTSNDMGYLKMVCPGYTGDDFYKNEPVATDDNLITASGIAPLEFSYEVFKKTRVMKRDTLDAWYNLYKTGKGEYYYKLMESISQN